MPLPARRVADSAETAVSKIILLREWGRVMISFVLPQARHFFPAILLLFVGLMALGSTKDRAWAVDGERTYRVVAVAFDDVLNIRRHSAGHAIVGEIPPAGRGVQLLGPCREWCPIRYNGASGWVSGRYLAVEPVVAPFVRRLPPGESAAAPPLRKLPPLPAHWRVTGVASADGLKVHEEPSLQAPVVVSRAAVRLHQACRRLPEAVVPGEVPDRRRRSGRLGEFQAPTSADGPCGWVAARVRPLAARHGATRPSPGRVRPADGRTGHSAFVHGMGRSTTAGRFPRLPATCSHIGWPGAHPVTCRRYIAIASAALFLAVTFAATLVPGSGVSAQGSCSSSCRASYGNCYKKSQDRAKCQAQLQRCLEGCIQKRR